MASTQAGIIVKMREIGIIKSSQMIQRITSARDYVAGNLKDSSRRLNAHMLVANQAEISLKLAEQDYQRLLEAQKERKVLRDSADKVYRLAVKGAKKARRALINALTVDDIPEDAIPSFIHAVTDANNVLIEVTTKQVKAETDLARATASALKQQKVVNSKEMHLKLTLDTYIEEDKKHCRLERSLKLLEAKLQRELKPFEKKLERLYTFACEAKPQQEVVGAAILTMAELAMQKRVVHRNESGRVQDKVSETEIFSRQAP